ncbi:hypothetical protein VE25_07405 [Devosia geojensis]|uniref:Uncharacterized protein n=1 Tax=Devosia geojensis TaxID=443610 RepID=A0A0F5FU19_9HYPH|nr:hypothetical protein [Devosia geojensis]KKB12371.1 hypothetical protein VE25_07405 [Devosia geojensis]
MKLYAIDQVSISSVKADTLRPGEPFEVSDAFGKELLERLPHAVSDQPPKGKAEPRPKNKMEAPPANKADPLDHDGNGRKGGAKKAE